MPPSGQPLKIKISSFSRLCRGDGLWQSHQDQFLRCRFYHRCYHCCYRHHYNCHHHIHHLDHQLYDLIINDWFPGLGGNRTNWEAVMWQERWFVIMILNIMILKSFVIFIFGIMIWSSHDKQPNRVFSFCSDFMWASLRTSLLRAPRGWFPDYDDSGMMTMTKVMMTMAMLMVTLRWWKW